LWFEIKIRVARAEVESLNREHVHSADQQRRRDRRQQHPAYDRVVLRNVLVLRAPTVPDAKTSDLNTTQKYSVMLAVTDSQASKLLFVVKNADPNYSPDGGWALQLRPVTNGADSPENIESIFSILLDGLSPAERTRVIGGK